QGASRTESSSPGDGRNQAGSGYHRDCLGDNGKNARALGATIQEREPRGARQALMRAYDDLTKAGVSTRKAAALIGIPRSSATRKQAPHTFLGPPAERMVANKLSPAERVRVLAVLNSEEFMDQAPLQVYAALLERGVYLCSVSTMYRILREHDPVRMRRRQARHPARKVPELVATGPGQVYTWDITKLPGPVKDIYNGRGCGDRNLLPLHRRCLRP